MDEGGFAVASCWKIYQPGLTVPAVADSPTVAPGPIAGSVYPREAAAAVASFVQASLTDASLWWWERCLLQA